VVVIDTRRGPLRYRLAFWPTEDELRRLADGAGPATLVKVVQTTADLASHSRMLRRGHFRTQVIDLQQDADDIFRAMGKTCRYEIRRVGRDLERVRVARNETPVLEDFFVLYNNFVEHSGHIPPLSQRRFKEYSALSDVWVLYLDERPMCARLTLRDESLGRACMIFSPSRRFENAEDAKMTAQLSRHLQWSELMAYRDEGFRAYDLGGIGDGTSSIARFKMSFGGVRVEENSYLLGGRLGRLADSFEKARTRSWRRGHAPAPGPSATDSEGS
jgi:hypothetical protein